MISKRKKTTVLKFIQVGIFILLIGFISGSIMESSGTGQRWRRSDRGDKILAEKFLENFKKKSPISTSLKDAFTYTKKIEDFSPHPVSATILQELQSKGKVILGPGVYDFYMKSYCLAAGKYSPVKGSGYLIASLKGSKSQIIKRLLENSAKSPNVSQQKVQTLIWAVESGAKYSGFSPELKKTAKMLLNEDELSQLGKSFWDVLPERLRDRILDRIRQRIPPKIWEIISVYNQLKSRIQRAADNYQELERIAMRFGQAPDEKDMINISQATWTYIENKFYMRVFPNGYSQTRVQIYVPKTSNGFACSKNRNMYQKWSEDTGGGGSSYQNQDSDEQKIEKILEDARKKLSKAIERINNGDYSPEAMRELLDAMKHGENVGLDATDPEFYEKGWEALDKALMENAKDAYEDYKKNPTKENLKKLMDALRAADNFVGDDKYQDEIHELLKELVEMLEKKRKKEQEKDKEKDKDDKDKKDQQKGGSSGVTFDPSAYVAVPANSNKQRLGFGGSNN